MSRRLRHSLDYLYFVWLSRFIWWPLPAALAIIAAQQGVRWLGWTRLRDAAITGGRHVWPVLVVGWPLLVATGMIVWRYTQARANVGLVSGQSAPRQQSGRRRWVFPTLIATAAGLLVLGAVLVVLPMTLVPAGAITDTKELYKARNDVRGTLVQVLAGGVVAIGLVFTARTLELNRSG